MRIGSIDHERNKRSSYRKEHPLIVGSKLSKTGAGFLLSVVTACGFSAGYETNGGASNDGGVDALAQGDAGDDPVGAPVKLGTAGNYVILAEAGISGTSATVTGDLGGSPAAASYITGFSLIADPTNVFSTSAQVTGRVYAADYAPPTPFNMTTAVGDMALAIADAAGRTPDVTELGAGNIGGMTLAPGVYEWSSGLLIPASVTLAGGANAVWIFQIAQDLTMSSGTSIVLSGGALPKNVFWQVAGLTMLGTTAQFDGIILCKTLIAVETHATINGRLFSQTAVTLQMNKVTQPKGE